MAGWLAVPRVLVVVWLQDALAGGAMKWMVVVLDIHLSEWVEGKLWEDRKVDTNLHDGQF